MESPCYVVNSIHTASTRVFIPGQHLKKSGRKAIGRFELDVANQGGKIGRMKSPMRILIPKPSARRPPKKIGYMHRADA